MIWRLHTTYSLSLISDLVYGSAPSWRDPVKYSFTHGGKDGFPYPVDREAYDNSIQVLQESLDSARLDKKERYDAIKRLEGFIKELRKIRTLSFIATTASSIP